MKKPVFLGTEIQETPHHSFVYEKALDLIL